MPTISKNESVTLDNFPQWVRPVDVRPLLFAATQEWISFLPRPGVYEHAVYGELDLNPAVIARIVENFKSGLYQQTLPINAEHDSPASGAIGWINDMRVATDGSIEVKPEWNARGQALLDGDRFRYVSAEWIPEWQDPVSGEWYQDVACGLAICTNPYFKTDVLRPLAASEEAAMALQHDAKQPIRWTGEEEPAQMQLSEDQPKDEPKEEPAVAPEVTPAPVEDVPMPEPEIEEEDVTVEAATDIDPVAVTLNEQTVREFNEMKRQLKEVRQEVSKLTAEKLVLLNQKRLREFTAEVRGKSDENNLPWIDDIEAHVAMLSDLADKFGDNSAQVRQYITINRANAKRMEQSNLFKEIGTGKSSEGMGAEDQLEAYAKMLRQSDPSLTKEGAYAKAAKENPNLYSELVGH